MPILCASSNTQLCLIKKSDIRLTSYLVDSISADIPSDSFERDFKLNYSVIFKNNDPMKHI